MSTSSPPITGGVCSPNSEASVLFSSPHSMSEYLVNLMMLYPKARPSPSPSSGSCPSESLKFNYFTIISHSQEAITTLWRTFYNPKLGRKSLAHFGSFNEFGSMLNLVWAPFLLPDFSWKTISLSLLSIMFAVGWSFIAFIMLR